MIIWIGATVAFSWLLLAGFSSLPAWATIFFSTVAAFAVGCWYRLPTGVRREELRGRGLVLSVEAGHWKYPEAELVVGDNRS